MALKDIFTATDNCHRKIGRLAEAFGVVSAVKMGGGGFGVGILAVGGLYVGRAVHNAWTQVRSKQSIPPFTRD